MATAVEKLSGALHKRMKEESKNVFGPHALILGRITSGMGLKLDDTTYTIPKGDYMICRSVMLNSSYLVTSESENHTHKLNIPILSVGDRVLVSRVGTEPVVIDIVVAG